MSISLYTEQTEFVFENVFDISVEILSTSSGKVYFMLSGNTSWGIDVPPMVEVQQDVVHKVKVRVYKPGSFVISAKINNSGLWEESNKLFLEIKEIPVDIQEEEKKIKEELNLKAEENQKIRPSLFWGDKEKNFQKQVATELVERVVNEYVLYFPIIVDNFHPLYGESMVKYYKEPIRLPCVIEWKGTENKNDKFSFDIIPSIIVHVLKRRAEEDLGLNVVVGDFIQYGRDFYEVVAVEVPTKLFYSFNLYVETVLTCVKARNNVFFLESKEIGT